MFFCIYRLQILLVVRIGRELVFDIWFEVAFNEVFMGIYIMLEL